jgi:hypothetical protein
MRELLRRGRATAPGSFGSKRRGLVVRCQGEGAVDRPTHGRNVPEAAVRALLRNRPRRTQNRGRYSGKRGNFLPSAGIA